MEHRTIIRKHQKAIHWIERVVSEINSDILINWFHNETTSKKLIKTLNTIITILYELIKIHESLLRNHQHTL